MTSEKQGGEPELPRDGVAGDCQSEAALCGFQEEVLAYVTRHLPEELRRSTDPSDVVQDVFFEAFARQGTFVPEGPDSLRRWLLTIARNRLTDLLRRHRSLKRGGGRRNEIDNAGHDSLIMLLGEIAIHEKTPSMSAMRHELAALVEQALGDLQPEYGQALRLRYIDEVEVAAIAQQLQRSTRAVHMLCHRGLRALRERLAGKLSLVYHRPG